MTKSFRTEYNPNIGHFLPASKPSKISSTYEPIFEAILAKKPLLMWAHHVNLPSLRTQFNRWRKKLPPQLQLTELTIDIRPSDTEPGKVWIVLRPKQAGKTIEFFIDEPGTANVDSQHENILPTLDKNPD